MFSSLVWLIYAGDGMKQKSKHAGDVRNRGSTLDSLASRRKEAGSTIRRKRFRIFLFFIFFSAALCHASSFILPVRHTGWTVGCSPPFVPLARVHRTLDPFCVCHA